MSLLILAVGWAYTQICRIYPDGGGVYTAGQAASSRMLGVIGALLLFADYTVTAQPQRARRVPLLRPRRHARAQVATTPATTSTSRDGVAERRAVAGPPGLWAIVAIVAIGAFNLLGPKHTGGFAIFAAVGMIVITLLIVVVRAAAGRLGAAAAAHRPRQRTARRSCGWTSSRSCWRCPASRRSPT